MDEFDRDPGFVPGAGSELARLRARVQSCLLDGPAVVPSDRRRAAYRGLEAHPAVKPLLDTVIHTPWKVSDELVAEALKSGLSEDAVFELVVTTSFGQANRQLAAAHRALGEVFPSSSDAPRPEEP